DFGPRAAGIAAAAEAGMISWRTSDRWTSRFGSPAMAALAMFACGTAFTQTQLFLQSAGLYTPGTKFSLLLVLALVYLGVGTLLITSLIKLKRGEPVQPLRILREHVWL